MANCTICKESNEYQEHDFECFKCRSKPGAKKSAAYTGYTDLLPCGCTLTRNNGKTFADRDTSGCRMGCYRIPGNGGNVTVAAISNDAWKNLSDVGDIVVSDDFKADLKWAVEKTVNDLAKAPFWLQEIRRRNDLLERQVHEEFRLRAFFHFT